MINNPLPVNFDNIPLDIKNTGRRWVVWKGSKVPFGKDLQVAKVNDPNTWLTFNKARHAYEKGGFSGVGIMLTPSLDLVGVDLDKCVEDGKLTRFHNVAKLMASNFYVEVSPSGTGIRAFTYGKLPRDFVGDGIEIYSGHGGRYLTLTGNVVTDDIDYGPAGETTSIIHCIEDRQMCP